MVRAAAKNHARVAVVVDPADYDAGARRAPPTGDVAPRHAPPLARRRSRRPPAYDAAIIAWLDADGEPTSGRRRRPISTLRLEQVQDLRYGENPHQIGARYRLDGGRRWWDDAVQHGGKELSYLTSTTPRRRGGSSTASTNRPA